MEFETDQPTRERVARSILEQGPSTAAALAARLDLTPAAVRRHLDHLAADGAIEARDPRPDGATRGRGRPAKVFAITDVGRGRFDQAYDDLAVQALRFLAETGGDEAVRAFADRRMSFIEERFATVLADDPALTPAEALARVFTDEGYVAAVREFPWWASPSTSSCASSTAPSPTSPMSSPFSRGRDRGDQPRARPPRAAAGHHRPRRRGVHHVHPGAPGHSADRRPQEKKVTT